MYSMLVFLTLTAAIALPVTEEEVTRFDYAGEAADGNDADVEKTPEGYLKHKPSRPGYGIGSGAVLFQRSYYSIMRIKSWVQ